MGEPEVLSQSTGAQRVLWDALGWNLMLWLLASLFLVLKMVGSRSFRSKVLTIATRIQERDEREIMIAGNAAKFSFLSTLALVLLLLFLSLFTVKIGKQAPDSLSSDGKKGYITIGMDFYPFTEKAQASSSTEGGLEVFNYRGVPLSNSLLFLIIILWQVGSYHLALKREEGLQ